MNVFGVGMAKKAQAEIVVIVGVLILAIAVVYYAVSGGFPSSNIPKNLYDRQKAFHDSFVNLVRKGADNALKSMEIHGGYPTAELLGNGTYQVPPFVVFMNEGIPYWTKCEQNLAPSKKNVTRWFELSVENYVKEHISEVTGSYRNVTIDLAKLDVSVNILSNTRKVDVSVNLPTTVDGYKMVSQFYPYKTFLDTKFGEIFDFADNFSKAQTIKRFLEVFTTASIYMSAEAPDGYPKLPTGGFLTSCGENIYRTPQQISGSLKEIAEYVVTQTAWWQNMINDTGHPKFYAINKEIIGTEYRDLDITMYLPDDFSFDTKDSIVITNNEPAYTSSMWTASDCLGVYSMGYAVSYPVIVRVKDPLSGYSFNFAILVFVDRNIKDKNGKPMVMGPGKCEDIKQGGDLCKQLDCSAKINITDENGWPVEGAVATFGNCGLGVSDISGVIEGKIKCGTNELNIYKNSSYDLYKNSLSSSEINNTYKLRTIADVIIHFRKVTITESGTGDNPVTKCVVDKATDYIFANFVSNNRMFAITNIDPKSIPKDCIDKACLDQCQSSNDISKCKQCSLKCMGDVLESVRAQYVPTGNYDLNVTQMNPGTMKETGGFITGYTIVPTANFYLNVPEIALPGTQYRIPENQKKLAVQNLSQCSIDPVSINTYPKFIFVTSCECDNLRTVLGTFRNSDCQSLTQMEIDAMCSGQSTVREIGKCNARVICK